MFRAKIWGRTRFAMCFQCSFCCEMFLPARKVTKTLPRCYLTAAPTFDLGLSNMPTPPCSFQLGVQRQEKFFDSDQIGWSKYPLLSFKSTSLRNGDAELSRSQTAGKRSTLKLTVPTAASLI